MNATDFIKQNGVDKARKELNKLPNSNVTHMTSDARMFIEENNPLLDEFQRSQIRDLICIAGLKRLVESIYLVKEHYTLERAKKYADSPYTAPEIKERLEQAIADYEQLFGNTETLELETLRDCDTSQNCKKLDEGVKP